ncbi:hypothetical protein [Domibacillus tundrae]|uniref:hypothetical protein n=1 Tax=Domibacillus tundrae TaxID=1587527 RepID=UPI000ABDC928|nr:hypothetical protein [Domibacillus tundrae]
MTKNNQSHTVRSEAVKKQLNQLESKSKNDQNKKGSTNEIQPLATDNGMTQ